MNYLRLRLLLLPCLALLPLNPIPAQKTSEWQRAYTFEESYIEMNTSNVVLGGDIGRVTFRWIFDQPEPLSQSSSSRYKTRVETIEFKCADKMYRMYEVTFLDSSGKAIQSETMKPPYTWLKTSWGGVMSPLLSTACKLIEKKTVALMTPEPISNQQIEIEKAEKLAESFAKSLQDHKDFNPIIDRFFAPDFLAGYLQDQDTNWFLNLNRDTAAKASHAELQRFYVALLNTGYLTSLYLASQSGADDESLSDEKMIPPDVLQLIKRHPFTAAHKSKQGSYDYLAENIDSLERLRSYTDLLEKLSRLMRQHVESSKAERSPAYRQLIAEWDYTRDLFKPRVRTCNNECFGLARGTRIFQVAIPMFQLQLANVKGELKVVSAVDYFH